MQRTLGSFPRPFLAEGLELQALPGTPIDRTSASLVTSWIALLQVILDLVRQAGVNNQLSSIHRKFKQQQHMSVASLRRSFSQELR